MKSLCEQSNLPTTKWKQHRLLVDSCDTANFSILADIQKNIDEFVDNGDNLMIYSQNCGNGKTSWAIKLLLSYFDKVWHYAGFECKGLFVNTIRFLNDSKRNISNPTKEFDELVHNIKTVPLVIWDDMASNNVSEYDSTLLYDLLDERLNKQLSNIYTTNCCENNLSSVLNSRLYSRIRSGSLMMEFKGKDMRGMKYD